MPLTLRFSVGEQRREIVARLAQAIEGAAQEVGAQRYFERLVEEAHPSAFQIEIVGSLQHLDQHQFLGRADDLSVAQTSPVVANRRRDRPTPRR